MTQILTNALLSLPLIGAFAIFALGIVVIYRASRVLNLAHGAMATVPAYVAYSLAQAGLPAGVVLPAAVAVGALLGLVVERAILRPLKNTSQTAQTVACVAVLGVLVAAVAKVWGTAPLRAPGIFPDQQYGIGRSVLHLGEIGLFATAATVAAAAALVFRATPLGLAMRGAAENPRAAALMGVDPDRTTAAAWAIGGALAATAGVLLAAVTNLHPFTLSRQVLPAFVAALIGGLDSIPGALLGAAVVGLVQGIVPGLGPLEGQTGSAQLVLAIVALIVMAGRGRRHAAAADLSPTAGGWPRRRARLAGRRRAVIVACGVAFGLLWPWLPLPDSVRGDANLAAIFVVVSVSLVVLTGWVGQISLAQGSFVGVAAFTTGLLVRGAGIQFPANLPLAAATSAGVAALLGIVALRVRGLYLAVATLIFGWMADAYLFKADWFVGEGGSSAIERRVVGRPGTIPSFDLTDRRIFWYIALAAAALAIGAAANLRDSKTGRAFFAIRSSEVAAASLGINVTRTKLFAFAFSGLLAGIAGNLIMIDQRIAVADQFAFSASLLFLSIAVVGGITSLPGIVIASSLFAALNEAFFRFSFLSGYLDIVSSVLLLLAVLSGAPAVRARFAARKPSAHAQPTAPTAFRDAAAHPATALAPMGSLDAPGAMPLELDGVTVRFGGLVAAHNVSLAVAPGEIVGLIGPNGAGKTTVFNAVSGLVVPADGRVRLFGRDVTSVEVHERAALGLGRTFQVLQLVREATVFDNLLVATHLHARSGPLQHLFLTDRAVSEERTARRRVAESLAFCGLDDVAHAPAGQLPFGTLRMVEVARALVTGAGLILLDEPASGLDEAETNHLAALLRQVRSSLGASLLVVEHDIRFVTGLCDRIYALERGRMIAQGTPDDVRADPLVVAAYLGNSPDAADDPVVTTAAEMVDAVS